MPVSPLSPSSAESSSSRCSTTSMRTVAGCYCCAVISTTATRPLCGICDICTGEGLPWGFDPVAVQQAADFLGRSERVVEPRKQLPSGKKIPAEHRLDHGRALSRWGDGGWGDLVRSGKQRDGRFDDRLVEAACDLIRGRWRPSPGPAWATFVPSLMQTDLVPDFTLRLSRALGIPCEEVVRKTRHTEPQKTMQNSQQQYRNVHGAFEVEGEVPRSPVLLVDDMVDSRWTLTVVGSLLRRTGSGPVLPFALADTSNMTI